MRLAGASKIGLFLHPYFLYRPSLLTFQTVISLKQDKRVFSTRVLMEPEQQEMLPLVNVRTVFLKTAHGSFMEI